MSTFTQGHKAEGFDLTLRVYQADAESGFRACVDERRSGAKAPLSDWERKIKTDVTCGSPDKAKLRSYELMQEHYAHDCAVNDCEKEWKGGQSSTAQSA